MHQFASSDRHSTLSLLPRYTTVAWRRLKACDYRTAAEPPTTIPLDRQSSIDRSKRWRGKQRRTGSIRSTHANAGEEDDSTGPPSRRDCCLMSA